MPLKSAWAKAESAASSASKVRRMAGISAYGAYVPMLRLALGKKGGPEKAVANWDEDAVTMAVAA